MRLEHIVRIVETPMLGSGMTREDLHFLSEKALLQRFSDAVARDCSTTAMMLSYIAEIDRRKLYLKHACSSMFAFCVERFHMSEAVTSKRIYAARSARRFPRIFEMVATGELHLTGAYQLAKHLTEENHGDVLERVKHKTMREIEHVIAEIAPKPDVPSRIVTLPRWKPTKQTQGPLQSDMSPPTRSTVRSEVTPLAPRRYKMQFTLDQDTHDKFTELQELMSHQVPDGDPARIMGRALDVLLEKMRKQKAALTDKPRKRSSKNGTRAIPAGIQRKVFKRDQGQCTFVDGDGNRCGSRRFIEFHHDVPFALGGKHDVDNIELRCQAHNQYQANLDYGEMFMTEKRNNGRRPDP